MSECAASSPGSIWRRRGQIAVTAVSWLVFVTINAVITLVWVVAPLGTGITGMADTYKLASLAAGVATAVVVVRMKRTYLLVPLAIIQMICFLAFASHLNTLCCTTVAEQLRIP
jgi:hypothetical protein